MNIGLIVLFCLMGLIILSIGYLSFVDEAILSMKDKWVNKKNAKDKVAKIAQVKLVSIDRREIETFISDNAIHLSDDMVKKLVARIESIRDDKIIADDELKVRYENLKPAIVEEEIPRNSSTRRV